MTPAVVVDVGNSAIKWGRCDRDSVSDTASLSLEDVAAWDKQANTWGLRPAAVWIVTTVNPRACDQFVLWIQKRGGTARILSAAQELPLHVSLDKPDHVGIDRLLDAVAANGLRPPGRPAVVVDAGSAVTVDWIDADGIFTGGAIMPGFRLMARSLHEHTALLPLIVTPRSTPAAPGTSTPSAMELGIYWSVIGGVSAILDAYRRRFDSEPVVFVTGGDSEVLIGDLKTAATHWPEMTLEGIRLTAEKLA
jgi:type III pantothenate kinase